MEERNDLENLTVGKEHTSHQRDRFGNTALHNQLLHGASPKVIKSSLDKHADVNSAGYFGYSPLQLSIIENHPLDLVESLIRHGANLNHRDLSGQSALHMAASKQSGKPYVQLLLTNGADVHAKDVRGQTPMHFVCYRPSSTEIVQMLLDSGASVRNRDANGQTPLHVPFHCFTNFNRYLKSLGEIVIMLFELVRDDDLNLQDNRGQTALHLVAFISHDSFPQASYNYILDVIQNLLELHKGSLAILDNNGNSPVDIAVNLNCNEHISNMFMCTALMLRYVNLPVATNSETDSSYNNRDLIELLEYDFDQKCNEYREECEAMKLIKFGIYSLYDIFSRSYDPSYLNNKEIAEGIQNILESPDLDRRFPNYGSLLKVTFKKRLDRLQLMKEAHEIFPLALPEEITRVVFLCLNDLDLENLIKALSFQT